MALTLLTTTTPSLRQLPEVVSVDVSYAAVLQQLVVVAPSKQALEVGGEYRDTFVLCGRRLMKVHRPYGSKDQAGAIVAPAGVCRVRNTVQDGRSNQRWCQA